MKSIEWAEKTWNPVTGCTLVSEGCKNCYAAGIAKRFWGDRKFSDVRFHPDRLGIPKKWKKSQRIFICSMGDLFHPDVDWIEIDQVLQTCYDTTQHTFLILTKRVEAAWYYFHSPIFNKPTLPRTTFLDGNIWIGATTENQGRVDERASVLLEIPRTIHFISIEPILGPISLKQYIEHLDWVIVGAETGPRKRPTKSEWIMDIVSQCYESKTPLFMKPNLEPYWTGKFIQEFPK